MRYVCSAEIAAIVSGVVGDRSLGKFSSGARVDTDGLGTGVGVRERKSEKTEKDLTREGPGINSPSLASLTTDRAKGIDRRSRGGQRSS